MTFQFRTLDDADVTGKRVLLRVDFNLPMKDGRVTDATRIEKALPTIRELSDKGARVILLAHFGRPKGKPNMEMSLQPIAPVLADLLGKPVGFADDCIGPVAAGIVEALSDGDVVLLENTRFHAGEETNDPAFSESLASLGELYVNDAFSAAHRAHGSTEGLAHHLPAYAGRTMQAEIEALQKGLEAPDKPVIAIVGGSKVSTKIDVLTNLVGRVDILVIGGGMANTFLAAQGIAVGKSLCEHDLADTARAIMARAQETGCEIVLPTDAVLARGLRSGASTETAPIDEVAEDMMILDAGPKSLETIKDRMDRARTLVWNGPLGAFEIEPFDEATMGAARHAAELTRAGRLVSIAGGGDTVAALNQAGVSDDFTYISMAGGAFLEWMEGKVLPGVEVLKA
ncbi:phosphoglycerate kinase [Fulvimarina sp. 2208YS6-2-32]|uniref:Phosphoglycerate kinase n=1 Tax=Fulvimarina uroteuthidis TaxID=3098149 RepID=A0ABU5I4F3_9HYPH|nr:phosphoglycerate kinase [Fulvimarina sp. 2208YS6-2-32]MDY8110267.1 phosphoglycerate kinase [Fulvimarina sp. 2208YS6-2-32]